jgi:diguanylate cyclase (GGDEF)-like protein
MVNDAWIERERGCELEAGVRVGDNYLAELESAEIEGSAISAGISRVLAGVDPRFAIDYRCSGTSGCEHWYMLTAEPIHAPSSGIVISLRDITGRKRAEAELAHRATHDLLTGLASRELVRERIERALERTDGALTVVMLADLDRFKVVNDSLGHLVGDRVLMTVARRFQAVTRSADVVGRLGGDEFVVVCEAIESREQANAIAERLLQTLQLPVYVEGRELHLRASVGIATATAAERGADDMLQRADTAMYAAKRRGGQRAVFFDDDLGQQAIRRLELEHDLRSALARGEIAVAYQPQYNLQTGVLTGFEALCRWTHPTRGPVSPAEFIPIAEEIDLAVELGSWIMSESIHHLAACDHLDPRLCLRTSVNVSPRQLVTPGFVEDVNIHLSRFGLAPDRLELEIVESAAIENLDEIISTMRQLRSRGVRVALDDFGTGTASLSQLGLLPVSTVKIDRSFIHNITDQAGDPVVVLTSILAIATVLGLDVVAEGIETQDQLDTLRDLGCQLGQGYLLGRPLLRTDREALPPSVLF